MPDPLSTFEKALQARRRRRALRNLSADERQEAVDAIAAYEHAARAGQAIEPRRWSFGERRIAAKAPRDSVESIIGPDLDRTQHQSEELVAAYRNEAGAQARRAAYPPAGHAAAFDDAVSEQTSAISALQACWGALLALRQSVEGQLALDRLLSPWIAKGADVVVFTADFIFFEETLRKAFDIPWKWAPASVFGIVGTFLLSLIGPTLVVISAITLGRLIAQRRAERKCAALGIDMRSVTTGDEQQKPDRGRLWRIGQFFRWLTSAAPTEWVGVMYLAAVVLVVVSAVYSSTLPARLGLAKGTTGGLSDNLWMVAILLFLLPLVSLLAHLAASNPLTDQVEKVEADIENARLGLQRAKRARAQHDVDVDVERARLDGHVTHAEADWLTAWTRLNETTARMEATAIAHRNRFRERTIDLLGTVRAIVPAMPLYPEDDNSDPAAMQALVPHWEDDIEDLNRFLAGIRETLRLYRPPWLRSVTESGHTESA